MIAIDSAVPRREEGTRARMTDMSASSMVSQPGRLPASLPHDTSVDAPPASSLPRAAGGMRSCLGCCGGSIAWRREGLLQVAVQGSHADAACLDMQK